MFIYEVVRHGARAPLSAVPLNGQLKMTDKNKKKEEKRKRKDDRRKRREEKKKKAQLNGEPAPEDGGDKHHKKKKEHHHHSSSAQKKGSFVKRLHNTFNQTKFLMHSSQYDEYESEKEMEMKRLLSSYGEQQQENINQIKKNFRNI